MNSLVEMQPIFCPQCGALILDAPSCAACGWQRPYLEGEAGKQLWRAELNRALPKPRASAVVVDQYLCLSAEDGTIVALNRASGQLAWERQIDAGRATHALATDGSQLLVSSIDTRPIPVNGRALLALDAATGADIWRYTTIGHSLSAVALADGTVYVSSSDGLLHSVETASGQAHWQVRHTSWGPEAPAADASCVYAGGRSDTLVAYAISDGAEQWRFSAGAWFASPLCLAGGQLYAPNWDGSLYALDAHTGRLLWKATGERGQGFTSPATADSELVYIGSRVYQKQDGQQTNAYALLALRAHDGSEAWRFLTPRHILAPPAFTGDSVLFGSEYGVCYALDANTGEQRWTLDLNGRIVTQPQIAGDAVYIGARQGTVDAIRLHAEQKADPKAPEDYLRLGQHELAAQAYALHSQFEIAAALFEELGRSREAALLYEHAAAPAQAALRWEALGELRRARDQYQVAGDIAAVARMLAALGEPLQAAKLYEELGDPAAAALYEQAGDRVKAADLYHSSGQIERASQIWQSLGQWERLANALIGDRNVVEAARLLDQHGQRERAAELYEQAEQWARALELRVALEHWERVADLAVRAGDPLNEAIAYEHMNNSLAAAQAYERAAQQASAATPIDEQHAAIYYEQAAQLYDAIFEDQHADQCRRHVRRYRHLPEIVVSGGAEGTFTEYQWNTLKLRVRNTGYGRAINIALSLRGPFDVESSHTLESLAPKKTASLDISIRPHREQYGPAVPLEIAVTYADIHSTIYSVRRRIPIRVLQEGAIPETTTPLTIDIRNNQRLDQQIVKPIKHANQEEIDQQQELLSTHRRTLAHLVRRATQYGGESFAPPDVANGLYEARENIRRIKEVLRGWGVDVDDHPNDIAEPG